jgi:hypothetical protein
MGSIRNRDAIGEPDDNGSGTKIEERHAKKNLGVRRQPTLSKNS